jgi:uncharacterized protein YndB with AHSA1/START domain
MSAVHVEASQHIDRPVAEVFAAIKDSEAFGKLAGVPMTCLVEGSEPGGPGTVRRVGPPILGPEETILEVVPNQMIRYRISKNGGPIRDHEAQMRVVPKGNGSELTWIMDFQVPVLLGPPMRATFPLVAKFALKRIAKGLERA